MADDAVEADGTTGTQDDGPGGGGSIADVVAREPRPAALRGPALVVTLTVILCGIALTALAPVLAGQLGGPASAETVEGGSGSPAAPSSSDPPGLPTATPDDEDTGGEGDDDRRGEDDSASHGGTGDGGRTPGDDDGKPRPDGGERDPAPGGSGSVDADDPAPDDDAADGGSAEGDDDGGSQGGTGDSGVTGDSGGTSTGDTGTGGTGDSGSSHQRPAYTVVTDARAVNLAAGCFPGSALDLDTLEAAASAANGQYELELSGCASNIQGRITTSRATAVLDTSGSRPGAAACANAASGGTPLRETIVDASKGLCLTTGGGRIAFVSVEAYNNSYTGKYDGSMDAVVTIWKKN